TLAASRNEVGDFRDETCWTFIQYQRPQVVPLAGLVTAIGASDIRRFHPEYRKRLQDLFQSRWNYRNYRIHESIRDARLPRDHRLYRRETEADFKKLAFRLIGGSRRFDRTTFCLPSLPFVGGSHHFA